MPELPEVEAARTRLEGWLRGRRILAFEVLDERVLVQDDGDGSALGASLPVAARRAKHLMIHAGSESWLVHLRMTGELLLDEPGGRAAWILDDGARVSLHDPRRLGQIRRMPTAALTAHFQAHPLGPEPWPERRDGAWWLERLAGARGPLKPTLMDQARVGGLGNIYAAEICWLARLSPLRPAGSLSPAEAERLAEAATTVLEAAVAACRAEPIVYVNQGGDNPFAIYQRQACPRCSAPLTRTTQAGRSTYWCPSCQDA